MIPGYKVGALGFSDVFVGVCELVTGFPLASDYTNKIHIATKNSGFKFVGMVSTKAMWQYPKGFYMSNGLNWVNVPMQVAMAEKSTILSNIEDWSGFVKVNLQVSQKDRILYKDVSYKNISGTWSSTPPDTDSANWLAID